MALAVALSSGSADEQASISAQTTSTILVAPWDLATTAAWSRTAPNVVVTVKASGRAQGSFEAGPLEQFNPSEVSWAPHRFGAYPAPMIGMCVEPRNDASAPSVDDE